MVCLSEAMSRVTVRPVFSLRSHDPGTGSETQTCPENVSEIYHVTWPFSKPLVTLIVTLKQTPSCSLVICRVS